MENIVIGTHNTMSYLKPKIWYYWFFKPIYACQNNKIEEQLSSKVVINNTEYNIEAFDIRVRFNEYGNAYFAHGIVEFKGETFYTVLDKINNKAKSSNKNYYVRMFLEDITYLNGIMAWLVFGKKRKDKEYLNQEKEFQTDCFIRLCEDIVSKNYSNIVFFGGIRKGDGIKVYNFNNNEPILHQLINSYPDETAVKPKRLEKIIPKLYAKRHNPMNGRNTNLPLSDISIYDFIIPNINTYTK